MRRRSPSRFFPVEAEQLLQAGDLASATELCKYGLVYFPENISGYAVLAQAYLMLEQPERALNVLEDGYRRTRAEGLKSFCDIIRGVESQESEIVDEVVADLQPVPGAVEVVESKSQESESQESEIVDEVVADLQPVPGTVEAVESKSQESEIVDEVVAGFQPALETVEAVESKSQESESQESEIADEVVAGFQPALETVEAVESKSQESEIVDEVVADLQPVPGIVEVVESKSQEPEIVDEVSADLQPTSSEQVEEEGVPEFRFVVDSYVELSEEPVKEGREEMSEVEDLSESEEDSSVDFPFFISFDSRSEGLVAEESDSDQVVELEGVRDEVESVVEKGREEALTTDNAVVQEGSLHSVSLPNEKPKKIEQRESESKPTAIEGESGEPIELSIRSGTRISRLRSSNLRLIPGLEFAPLRRDEPKLKIAPLVQPIPPEPDVTLPEPEEPSQPERSEEMSAMLPDAALPEATSEIPLLSGLFPQMPSTSSAPMTPLEELARRLETARIPIVEGESTEREETAFEPSIVSETFAGILVKQGAYQEAIKAYQMLSRLKPERRADFEQKIEEVRWKMTNVVQGEE
ncbi:MAG: hypothetical protein KDD67_04465 [Ignavibacteriae bacterium]|nr:hypothetical protein [Ignavibacteriota bacterium]MCB9214862.1 hypothetical protein [Ignavibacteria bacterium]